MLSQGMHVNSLLCFKSDLINAILLISTLSIPSLHYPNLVYRILNPDKNIIRTVHTCILFIFQIGQAKAMAKIRAWSDHIIRHFWYCSNMCKESENTSDEEALKIMKVGEIKNGYY